MYKPLFVDSLLSASHETRGNHQAIRQTIQHIEQLNKFVLLVTEQFGEDAKQNILQANEVEYALKKILDYHTNTQSTLSDESFAIYRFFVVNKLNQAERIFH